ncbi:MAG: hypothetical protein ACOYYF_16190 [Chloroflexota bacterium]
MSNSLRKQIYNNFKSKETDELVEIWQKNDRTKWSEDAFSVIQEILQERLGELPPQNAPILEHEDTECENDEDKTDFVFLMDDENLPEFYNPYEVLQLENWLNKAAVASIVASVVSSLIVLPQAHRIILSYFMGDTSKNFIAWLITVVFFIFGVGLQSIIIYFPLKALGSILKILMEMEFNSRGAAKTKNA